MNATDAIKKIKEMLGLEFSEETTTLDADENDFLFHDVYSSSGKPYYWYSDRNNHKPFGFY